MSEYILAVRAGHNASAAIGDSRRLRFAIQEERLTGEKNYWGYPSKSIEACLSAVGATPADLALVASGGIRVSTRYHDRSEVLRSLERHQNVAGRVRQRVLMPLVVALLPSYGHGEFSRLLAESGLGEVPLERVDHHTAHAATAYYGLRRDPKEPYLVLTCDGSGDTLCATVRVMGDGKDEVVAETSMTHSLGALWAWVTYSQGFVPFEHEYKLMGMAPYVGEGPTAKHAELFHRYLGLDGSGPEEGGLRFARKIPERISNISDRLFRDFRAKRFDYLAAGLQRFTEELLCQWVRNAVRKTGVRRVLAAGGVFMNVKANQRIAELDEVEQFEAFPSCGDETLPLGAYYLSAAKKFGDAEVEALQHFYLGDDLEEEATLASIRDSGLHYEKPDDMASAVAELLIAGKPVARCAGRMEFGARALGNRSILADPIHKDVVGVINHMVKKRDFWMPFAPMVLAENHADYMVNPKGLESPYMMMTFDTRENSQELAAAVHDVDRTCRAQILRREQNPEMAAILDAFRLRTGRGVLLNTSFNLHGFPIVRTGQEAIEVLQGSGLEYLQLGEYLVSKRG